MKQNKKLLILALIFIMVLGLAGYFTKPAKAAALISYWNFNANVNDSAGSNNGTLQGGASVSSNYLKLSSSTSDYVSVPDDDSLDFASGLTDLPFTMSAWVKASNGDVLNIVSKGTASGNNLAYMFTYNGANGTISFYMYDSGGGGSMLYGQYAIINDVSSQDFISDAWYHLAVSYDGSATIGGLKFYVNGAQVASTNNNAFGYDLMRINNDPLFIGRANDTYSDGSIDELRIYNDDLTAGEISALFAGQAAAYRNSRANALVLDASGQNLVDLDTTADDVRVIFTPINEVNAADGIEISFASGFQGIDSVTGLNTAITQIYETQDITEGAVSVSGQNVRIIVTAPSDRPAEQLTVDFTNVITTPIDSGTYIITAKTYDLGADGLWGGAGVDADTLESSASTAVVFGDFSVDISASVDPTLTLSFNNFYDASGNVAAANTCNLSTSSRILISTEINLCLYAVNVSTNANGGYTAYVRDTGNLSTGIDEMTDAGATMSPNPVSAEYGIATTATGRTINQINNFTGGGVDGFDCAYLWTNGTQTGVNSSAVTDSDQDFAGASAPVSGEATVLCHMAAIAGDTPNGTYTTTTIITVVGNF